MREPYPHQKKAAAFLFDRPRAALFDEQGLGKTTSALLAIDQVWKSVDLCRPALVVAPASVAHNWRSEAYAVMPWLRDVDVFVKDKGTRRIKSDVQPMVYITTHSLMRSKKVIEEIEKLKPGIVVLDEAHYMRNRTAAMTRSFYRLVRDLHPMHAWNLTGTPMPNWPADLFTWLKSYHPAEFPESFIKFRNQYHDVTPSDYGEGVRIVGQRNISELKRRMSGLFMRRRTEDVIDLPVLRHESYAVHAPLDGAMLDLDEELSRRWNVATDDEERMRVLLDDAGLSRFRRWCGMAKVEPIVALLRTEIESEPDPKKVVFYHHQAVGDALQDALRCRLRIEGSTPSALRPRIVEDFQSGEHPVILCQLQAASTGITLTASNDLLFAEQSWSPGEMAQAAKRIHRIGQRRRSRVRHVFAEGTVDELVARVLQRKTAAIQEALA
tara:strand:- start:7244 stop:8560 length:1317 start_codon:yes stop_codon:yes gene_type:complete